MLSNDYFCPKAGVGRGFCEGPDKYSGLCRPRSSLSHITVLVVLNNF